MAVTAHIGQHDAIKKTIKPTARCCWWYRCKHWWPSRPSEYKNLEGERWTNLSVTGLRKTCFSWINSHESQECMSWNFGLDQKKKNPNVMNGVRNQSVNHLLISLRNARTRSIINQRRRQHCSPKWTQKMCLFQSNLPVLASGSTAAGKRSDFPAGQRTAARCNPSEPAGCDASGCTPRIRVGFALLPAETP